MKHIFMNALIKLVPYLFNNNITKTLKNSLILFLYLKPVLSINY